MVDMFACITDGVVINVILADQEFIDGWLPTSGYDEAVDVSDMDPWPSAGWTWDGTTFTPGPDNG
jgi:hypothetical protein